MGYVIIALGLVGLLIALVRWLYLGAIGAKIRGQLKSEDVKDHREFAFEAITLFGTGDPKLMAGGISQALVTTVLGLCVAIPLVLLHSVVAGRSKALIEVLEEQSAGIIAKQSESYR